MARRLPAPARFADTPALSRRARGAVLAVIVLAHGVLGYALVRAFGGVQALAGAVGLGPVLTATVVADKPPPPARAVHSHQDEGASGTRSGAAAAGEGTGGTVSGSGTGSGGTGTGLGGHYVATRPVKIAGDLVEGDYPRAGRARRLGTAVIVLLTVGTDGRVTACRVHQPSGDPEADAVTCKLALERFRFNPALDRNGAPVESLFGWQQRFFWK
jgi:protein TonB